MQDSNHCLNCGKALLNHPNFCSYCGQKAHLHRLNLHFVFHELFHFFTHADKGIIYLVKMLLTQPGIVAREYIAGKRKKIFSPLNFFLIAVGIFLFVQTTFHPLAGGADFSALKEEVLKMPDQVTRERRLLKLERREKATNFMARYSNIINFVVTPFVALLFFLFFRRAGFNYTEHLVTNMYLAGFSALVFVFVIAPYLLLTKTSVIYYAGIVAFLLFEIVYRAVGYYQFIGRRGTRPALYSVLVSFNGPHLVPGIHLNDAAVHQYRLLDVASFTCP